MKFYSSAQWKQATSPFCQVIEAQRAHNSQSQWPPKLRATWARGENRNLKPKRALEDYPCGEIKYSHYLSNVHMQIILKPGSDRIGAQARGRKGSFKNLLVGLVCIWIGLGLEPHALSRYGFVINIVHVLLRLRAQVANLQCVISVGFYSWARCRRHNGKSCVADFMICDRLNILLHKAGTVQPLLNQ